MLVTYGTNAPHLKFMNDGQLHKLKHSHIPRIIPPSTCEVLKKHHRNQLNGLQHNIPLLQRDRKGKEKENAPITQTRLTSPCPNSTPAQRTSNLTTQLQKRKKKKEHGTAPNNCTTPASQTHKPTYNNAHLENIAMPKLKTNQDNPPILNMYPNQTKPIPRHCTT